MSSSMAVYVFTFATILLFSFHIWVNKRQSSPYMDELFHIPQACELCNASIQLRRPAYDPSITTLPGLYIPPLILCTFTRSTRFCSPCFLRFMSMLAALLALPLIGTILQQLRHRAACPSRRSNWLYAFAIWLQPVLLFYANLFYTDAPGMMYTLLAWSLALSGKHVYSAFAGIFATLTRQTNMVWHAFIVLDSVLQAANVQSTTLEFVYSVVTAVKKMWPHVATGVLYAAFLVVNGGVAVGHREHHHASLHYAMFPYFLGFHALSFLPFQLISPHQLVATLSRLSHSRELLVFCTSVAVAVASLIIASGDQVHPFILADNRHFTFYIYRRWLLKSQLHRLILVPIYVWAIVSAYMEVNGREQHAVKERMRLSFVFGFAACVLIPSPLMEPRYFTLASTILSMYRVARSDLPLRSTALVCLHVALVFVNVVLVFVFTELPFERPVDTHMPTDKSPGRFMF